MAATETLFPSSIHPVPPTNSNQHVLFKNPRFFQWGSRILFSFLYVPFPWWEEKYRLRVEDQSQGLMCARQALCHWVHPSSLPSTIHTGLWHTFRPIDPTALLVWQLRELETHSEKEWSSQPPCLLGDSRQVCQQKQLLLSRASLELCGLHPVMRPLGEPRKFPRGTKAQAHLSVMGRQGKRMASFIFLDPGGEGSGKESMKDPTGES